MAPSTTARDPKAKANFLEFFFFLLSKITSTSQVYCKNVNEMAHIKCQGKAWHTINPPHMKSLHFDSTGIS
jgi:hypothetical protein